MIFALDMLTIVLILLLNAWHVHYVFMYFFHNCYSMIFGHVGLCCRANLRMGDATFEIQFSFHVWDLWIRCPPWKLYFIKFIHVKKKTKVWFFLCMFLEIMLIKLEWLTWKIYRIQRFVSRFYVHLKHKRLK